MSLFTLRFPILSIFLRDFDILWYSCSQFRRKHIKSSQYFWPKTKITESLNRKVAIKMFKKQICVIGAVVIYSVLIISFFICCDSGNQLEHSCSDDKACVQFCCNNKSTCNEEFIRQNFNGSNLPTKLDEEHNEVLTDFKILLSRPDCLMEIIERDQFTFHIVSIKI